MAVAITMLLKLWFISMRLRLSFHKSRCIRLLCFALGHSPARKAKDKFWFPPELGFFCVPWA